MNNHQKLFQKAAFGDNDSKYPSLEDIYTRKSYSITINPNEQHYDDDLRIYTTYNDLDVYLKLFNASIELYPELSMKNSRLHFHGYIRFSSSQDISLFYMNTPKIKQYCQFEIDKINDNYIWYSYCRKQKPQMVKLLEYYHLPYRKNHTIDSKQAKILINKNYPKFKTKK